MARMYRYQTELFIIDERGERVGNFIEIDFYNNLKTAKREAEELLKTRKTRNRKHTFVVAILDNKKDDYIWSKEQKLKV